MPDAQTDSAALAARRELLRRAEVRLHQALDHPRWDWAACATACDAVDLLRTAGFPELADRLNDIDCGSDLRAVADEVTKLRAIEAERGT